MLRIAYFLEDNAHEQFIPPLVERLADDKGIAYQRISVTPSGISRGSQVINHFRQFLRDGSRRFAADILVVCIDDDCKGYNPKREPFQVEIERVHLPLPVLYAIPRPYIEFWYLADKSALCKSLDVPTISTTIPKDKCERTIYKELLKRVCKEADIESTGIEFGRDIVANLPLQGAMKHHPARTFIEEARQALGQAWQRLTQQA